MKRVGRGCWAAALGMWLWLGFGLHRELPRDLGPVVCKLPLVGFEETLGFLGDESVVVAQRLSDDGNSGSYRLWDVTTRTPKFETPIDFLGNGEIEIETQFSVGFVVGEPKPSEDRKESDAPLQAFDLRTGLRRVLCTSPRRVYTGCFHDRRAWMAAVNDLGDIDRLEVYDLQTGMVIFNWAPANPKADHRIRIHSVRWIPHTDSLYIAYWVIPHGFQPTESHQIEIWNVPSKTRQAHHALSDVYLHTSGPATNGRVLFGQPGDRPTEFAVVDCLTGSVVFSNRHGQNLANSDDPFQSELARRWSLSENGRRLISSTAVWDIDRNRMVWSAVWGLEELVHDSSANSFFVAEQWSLWFLERGWTWLPSRIPNTWAVRDLETGSVLYRVYDGHPRTTSVSSDGILSVRHDGTIYRLPPRPNYPLLALCQAILALPLVLLWAALRWRRKRRARLMSVTP